MKFIDWKYPVAGDYWFIDNPFAFFIIGTFLGSFCNVLIYRIPKGENIVWPSSFCPKCGRPLKPLELIPILSYLFLKGRCSNCKKRISVTYPLVEFLMGIITALLYLKFFNNNLIPEFFIFLFLSLGLLAILFIDLNRRIIPDKLTYPYAAVALVLSFYPHYPLTLSQIAPVVNAFLGAVIGGGALFLISMAGEWFYKKPVLGMGDVKLAFMLGAFVGTGHILLILFLSFFYGAAISLGLVLFKKLTAKSYVAFGPYIVLAAFTDIFIGNKILEFYFSLHQF